MKGIEDAVGRDEFGVSSDALNFHRIMWRCIEEWGTQGFDAKLGRQVKSELCRLRGYDPDDFESALLATKGRARLPFGWTALDLARFRARLEPIRLLDGELAHSRLATEIAAIALQLQRLQKEKPILLPIDQLREMFSQRKVVVSGAVLRLVEAGLLKVVDGKYHTGSAGSSSSRAWSTSILRPRRASLRRGDDRKCKPAATLWESPPACFGILRSMQPGGDDSPADREIQPSQPRQDYTPQGSLVKLESA